MEKKEKTGRLKDHFVWVKDRDGNEFVCPIHALKDPDNLTEEEKAKCISAVSTRGLGVPSGE